MNRMYNFNDYRLQIIIQNTNTISTKYIPQLHAINISLDSN